MIFQYYIFLCALLIHQVLSDFTRIQTKFLQKINAEPEGTIFNVIVEMKPVPNLHLKNILEGVEGTARAAIISQVLEAEANDSQFTLIQSLLKINPPPLELETLFISNKLFFKAGRNLILLFARDNGKLSVENVKLVREESSFRKLPDVPIIEYGALECPSDPKWHIEHIGATKWYEKGYDGTGVIVGHIDTGVDYKHVELHRTWLGNPFGWKDPANNKSDPHYADGHGTTTLSLIVGQTTGIAPGATWISCLNTDQNGSVSEAMMEKCGDFLLCPDRDTNCTRRPRVINCSFGIPDDDDDACFYLSHTIYTWREAEIIPVFAAGNFGHKGCSTLCAPSDRDDVFSVGSIGIPGGVDTLAPDSSKGPAIERFGVFGSKNVFKPDFVAPGWLVRVATVGGGYGIASGTSLAAAVVSGSIALLLSRNTDMTYKQVEDVFHKFTKKEGLKTFNDTSGNCGDIEDDMIPNFKFGYGSIRLPDPNDPMLGPISAPSPVPEMLSKDLKPPPRPPKPTTTPAPPPRPPKPTTAAPPPRPPKPTTAAPPPRPPKPTTAAPPPRPPKPTTTTSAPPPPPPRPNTPGPPPTRP